MTYESKTLTNPYGSTDTIGVLTDCLTGAYTLAPLEKIVDDVVTFFVWLKTDVSCSVIIDVLGLKQTYFLTGNKWTKVEIKNADPSTQNVVLYPLTDKSMYLYEASLQVGNTPTEWYPAKEDLESRITKNETDIKQNADEITLRATKVESQGYADTALADAKTWVTNQAYLTVNSEAITSKVSKNNVISSINQTSESVTISASKINLNGAVTANNYFKINTDGSMTCVKGTFTGSVSASTITGGSITIGNGKTDSTKKEFKVTSDGTFSVTSATAALKVISAQNSNWITEYGPNWVKSKDSTNGVLGLWNYGHSSPRVQIISTSNSSATLDYTGHCAWSEWCGGTSTNYVSEYAVNHYFRSTSGGWGILTAGRYDSLSSRKAKENIVDISDDGGNKVLELRPVHFDYKEGYGGEKFNCGLIAEEVLEVLPEIVYVPSDYDESLVPDDAFDPAHPPLRIDYGKITPHIIKLCQNQQNEIDELKSQVSALLEKIGG